MLKPIWLFASWNQLFLLEMIKKLQHDKKATKSPFGAVHNPFKSESLTPEQ